MGAPSRRDVLGVGTSVLGVGAGLALMVTNAAAFGPFACPKPALATSPDAELLELCAAIDALQLQADALWSGPAMIQDDDARDDLQAPITAEQIPLIERMCEIRPATLQGHVARCLTYYRWDKNPPDADSPYCNEAMQGAILRDLMALAEVAA